MTDTIHITGIWAWFVAACFVSGFIDVLFFAFCGVKAVLKMIKEANK